jgi:hypothetical protein
MMETISETRKIEIDQESLNYLSTTRKWTMFLAIIGFIFLGLFVVIGVIAGTFLSAFNTGDKGFAIPDAFIFIILLVLAAVYFFPILFLFRFSKHMANAVSTLEKVEINKAFKNLKSYFIYIGVMIIIVLLLYAAVLLIAGTSMAFLKGL